MLNYITDSLADFKTSFDALKSRLEGLEGKDGTTADLDINLSIDETQTPISIAQFIVRIDATIRIIEGLPLDDEAQLIPFVDIDALDDELIDTKEKVDTVLNNFANADQAGGITSIEGDSLQINISTGPLFSLVSALTAIFTPSDKMLSATLKVHKLVQSEGFSDFSTILQGWSDAYARIAKEREAMSSIIDEITDKHDEVVDIHEKAAQEGESISELLKSASDDNEEKQKEINEIKAKIQQIREITTDASTLSSLVTDYDSEFKSFDKALEARNKSYTAARKELDDGIEYIEKSRETIETQIAQSEQMLTGATVTGLASKFSELLVKLDKQVDTAAFAFYVSIGLLAASCLPILDYFFEIWPPEDRQGESHSPQDLLIRSILLVPASWLTQFNARKYAHLFKLKEHYAYKYSIASSVQGFKVQAPGYEEEIAFAAFFDLAFNPALEIDGKKMPVEHPIREFANRIVTDVKTGLSTSKSVEPSQPKKED